LGKRDLSGCRRPTRSISSNQPPFGIALSKEQGLAPVALGIDFNVYIIIDVVTILIHLPNVIETATVFSNYLHRMTDMIRQSALVRTGCSEPTPFAVA